MVQHYPALRCTGVTATAHKGPLSVQQALLPRAGNTAQHRGAGSAVLETHRHIKHIEGKGKTNTTNAETRLKIL